MDKLYHPTEAIRNVMKKRQFEVSDFVDFGGESRQEENDNQEKG